MAAYIISEIPKYHLHLYCQYFPFHM